MWFADCFIYFFKNKPKSGVNKLNLLAKYNLPFLTGVLLLLLTDSIFLEQF